MRKILLICTAIFFVAFASNAFAEVQNVKVSGDIAISGVSRDNFSLGQRAGSDRKGSIIMTNARLRVDADLTDNVSTTIRLLHERDWDVEETAADDTGIDVDLAYITLKEALYSPLTLTLGRQEIRFGNGLIVGDPDTNRTAAAGAPGLYNRDLSLRKAFDALRATLDYNPLTVDLVYSKIDENDKVNLDDKDDIDLYGVNASYDLGDNYGTTAEAYFWYKRDETFAENAAGNKTDKIYCPGARVSTNPIENLNLQAEVAWQFGTKDVASGTGRTRKRNALAWQAIANYNFDTKYSPTLGLIYSWLSSDKNPTADLETDKDDYKGWDPMFEDQTLGHIANSLFAGSGVQSADLKGNIKPIDDLTVALDVVFFWLTEQAPGNILSLYLPNNTALTPVLATNKRHVGNEYDLNLTYDYTEDVQFGLLLGYFDPGSVFVKSSGGVSNRMAAKEAILSCKVAF